MKNNYNLFERMPSLKRLMFFFAVTSALAVQSAKAQKPYKMEGDSQVKVAVDSIKSNFTASASTNELNAEGTFIIKDGLLEDVTAFKLAIPIAKATSLAADSLTSDSIGFKLTHVMVLPHMRLIHIVGMLDVAGVSKRTELDFSFIVNDDKSLTLFGTKSIKLSEYNQEQKFNAVALKKNNELKLNLNLVFKDEQQNIAALETK